ncbi:GAF domain-containing protein [Modestobacter excelsi]|uniref:GAF domain-containing protein n=1 Tax=Modestobacter excelsi TaxID=2213161 RepID=UPI00110CDA1B|nr:GAF domain-containing protein [Modestobacter excelsi]
MESTGHELPTWAPLPARADEVFDELAARVCAELRVQRALVVLVSKSGQVYPGAHGLPEPWETRRSMPLSHSMSLRVVSTGRPLVLRDAREDPELRDSPGVVDMQIVAYAAMPLADVHGRPIGVLSVSDDQPRDWSPQELAALHGLAAEAARRLQFQALELAEREAVATAARAAVAASRTADAARAAYVEAEAAADRARIAARLSQELQPAETLLEVLHGIDRFVRSPLGATVALLGLAETGSSDLRVWAAEAGSPPTTRVATGLHLTDAHPMATAVRERRPVPVGSRAAGEAEFPALARFPVGAESALAVPIVLGQHTAAAGLLVGWGHTRELDAPLSAVVTDLARHVGHALDRVLLRAQRLRLAATSPPVPVSA